MNKKLSGSIVIVAMISLLIGTFILAQNMGYSEGWIQGYGKAQQETLANIQAILDKGGVIFNYTKQLDGSYIIQIMRNDGDTEIIETASVSESTFKVLNVNITQPGLITLTFTAYSIHTTITIYKDGQKVLDEYHAGVVTQLGMNVTLAKLTGNITAYNATQIPLNLTYISIGNNTGTLAASSTVLPNEWNRTAATMHDCTYNSFNLTAVFVGASASQTADCIGVNFEADIANNALWGYDTFTEVSGIDGTFTITIEMKVTVV